jgi:hypothetical protein
MKQKVINEGTICRVEIISLKIIVSTGQMVFVYVNVESKIIEN